MMISEITEEEDEETPYSIDKEAQKERIRRIIEHQKSLYLSSSSSSSLSSSAASCSSLSSSSLATHFKDYSGSPIIKPILLWGSDTDDGIPDLWTSIKQIGPTNDPGTDRQCRFASEDSFMDGEFGFQNRKMRIGKRKLTRKKSFRRLPRFSLWRCRGFRFRLRLRRLRVMICGRKF